MRHFFRFLVSKVFIINVLIAIILVGGGLYGILYYLDDYTRHNDLIKVPNLVGEDIEEVERQLSKRQKTTQTARRKTLLSVEGIEGYGERVLRDVSDLIALPLRHPAMFRGVGVRPSCGIVLTGATGSGKSMLMEKCVEYLGKIHYQAVNATDLLTKPPPEDGVKILERMFTVAAKNAPSLIFIDQIEEIGREYKTVYPTLPFQKLLLPLQRQSLVHYLLGRTGAVGQAAPLPAKAAGLAPSIPRFWLFLCFLRCFLACWPPTDGLPTGCPHPL